MTLKTKVTLRSRIFDYPTLRQELANVIVDAVFETNARVAAAMQSPKSGRTYARGALRRKASRNTRKIGLRTQADGGAIIGYKLHRASASGEAAAVDTGQLLNSIKPDLDGVETSLKGTLKATAAYAAMLEYKLNRPAFAPAMREVEPGFVRAVDAVVKRLCD